MQQDLFPKSQPTKAALGTAPDFPEATTLAQATAHLMAQPWKQEPDTSLTYLRTSIQAREAQVEKHRDLLAKAQARTQAPADQDDLDQATHAVFTLTDELEQLKAGLAQLRGRYVTFVTQP